MVAEFQVVVEAGADGAHSTIELSRDESRIGRDASSDVVLASPFVSRLHGLLLRRNGKVWLRAEGLNPTLVNERELTRGESVELRPGDAIVIQGFSLRIQPSD